MLDLAGHSERAVAVYCEVIKRFGSAVELPLRELVAEALGGKGVGLSKLGRSEEAIAIYDILIHRFANASEF